MIKYIFIVAFVGSVINCQGIRNKFDKFSSVISCNNGLLTGIEDVSKSSYYSSNMDLGVTEILAKDTDNYIYKVALDCFAGNETQTTEHLKNIGDLAQDYVRSDEICDRDNILYEINEFLKVTGTFCCILGGKNVGKSFLLNKFKDSNEKAIVCVNLQNINDLLLELIAALEYKLGESFFKFFFNFIATPALSIISRKYGVKSVLDVIQSNPISSQELQPYLFALIARGYELFPGKAFTIIIDDANRAFDITSSSKSEDIDLIKNLLQLFITLTKEQHKINIILASSDHSFPYRLSDQRLGFDFEYINKFVYFRDVNPQDMYRLLTEKWLVHKKLATALISIYGGNIYNLANSLFIIDKDKRYIIKPKFSHDVHQCLYSKGVDNKRMVKTLKLLSERGFAPLSDFVDPVVEIISLNNVGGVVAADGLNHGIDKVTWGSNNYGLVPTSQSMRLAIAKKVLEFEQRNYPTFVAQCLASKEVDKKSMVQYLRLLSEQGFAPLTDYNDPIAEIISSHNVGEIVLNDGNNHGTGAKIEWGNYVRGIVPVSESVRLLMAKAVAGFEKQYPSFF